jgi:ribose transport system substrate-binding protein
MLEMKKLRFLVSLTTHDNDYQQEQARAAEETARRLGAEVDIIYANNDSVNQSQQLLQAIQSSSLVRHDAIIFEPVGGTAFPIVAKAATGAGIGWVVLNREIDYIATIRKIHNVPVFSVTSNHAEIGRIQGRQFAALLPKGGFILHIEGPSGSSAARQRTAGMFETKPANIQIKALRSEWTSESATHAVQSWLRLSTSLKTPIDLIGCQCDAMALGARNAFQDLTDLAMKERWLSLPYTGCDGLPQSGQEWVREGLMSATVVVPANTGLAIEMLVKTFQDKLQPPEETLTTASSYPPIELLAANGRKDV